jgi:hypothetical protein
MYLCIRNINVVSFYNFDIWFFGIFQTVWYVLSFSLFVHYQLLFTIYHIKMCRVSSMNIYKRFTCYFLYFEEMSIILQARLIKFILRTTDSLSSDDKPSYALVYFKWNDRKQNMFCISYFLYNNLSVYICI